MNIESRPLAFVRWPIALLISSLATLPFLFTAIPPLTDVPGHIGRFAVQTAPASNPLFHYFGFHWAITLNLASDLIVQIFSPWIDVLPLTWLICAATAFLTTLGIVIIARVTNPLGASALPWALLFVFNFPFLWGFLNFSLTFALAMPAFAAWLALERRRAWRAPLFIVIPPALLIGHGVAGFVGVGLIVAYTVGEIRTGRRHQTRSGLARDLIPLWVPVGSALIMVVIWKALESSDHGLTLWLKERKIEVLLMMLRDQNKVLDIGTVAACLMVVLVGWRWGARFSGGGAAAVLFVTLLFVATPSLINGSDRIDTRLAPLISC